MGVLVATASTAVAFVPLNPITRRVFSATANIRVTPNTYYEEGDSISAAITERQPLPKLSIRAMKVELQRFGVDHRDLFERADLERRLVGARAGTRGAPPPDVNTIESDGLSDKSGESRSRFRRQKTASTKGNDRVGPDKGLVESWWRQLGAEKVVDRFVRIDEERPWEWAEKLAPSDVAARVEADRIAYDTSKRLDNESSLDSLLNATTTKLREAVDVVAAEFINDNSTEGENERSIFDKAAFWAQNNNSNPTTKSGPSSKLKTSTRPKEAPARSVSSQPTSRLPPIPEGGYAEVREWATSLGQSSGSGAAALVEILASRGLGAEAAESQDIEARAALLASDVASARALAAKRSADQVAVDHVAEIETTGPKVPRQIDASEVTTRVQESQQQQQQQQNRKAQKTSKVGPGKGATDVSVLEALLEAERWWARALPRHKLEAELTRLLSGRPRLAALLLDAPSLADESSSSSRGGVRPSVGGVASASGTSAAEMVAAVAAKDECSGTPVVTVALAGMSEAMAKLDDAALAEVLAVCEICHTFGIGYKTSHFSLPLPGRKDSDSFFRARSLRSEHILS